MVLRGNEFKPDILGKPVASDIWREEVKKLADDLEADWQKYARLGFKVTNENEAKAQAKRLRDLPVLMAVVTGRNDILAQYRAAGIDPGALAENYGRRK